MPSEIVLCIAAIVIGVAIIMFTLLRPAKGQAQLGSRPRIDLGDEVPEGDEGTTENDAVTEEVAREENSPSNETEDP